MQRPQRVQAASTQARLISERNTCCYRRGSCPHGDFNASPPSTGSETQPEPRSKVQVFWLQLRLASSASGTTALDGLPVLPVAPSTRSPRWGVRFESQEEVGHEYVASTQSSPCGEDGCQSSHDSGGQLPASTQPRSSNEESLTLLHHLQVR